MSSTATGTGDLLRLADLSLAEFLRHLARFGGAIAEEDGLLLFAGAHPQPNPYRNGVLRLDNRVSPHEALRRAGQFFSARGSGYVVWTREHADSELEAVARESRFVELDRLPELVLERLPDEIPPPAGVELRHAGDRRTRRDYLTVVANAWGSGVMPVELAARVFFDPRSVDAPNVAAVVAYADDVPVSGAMAFVTHGVALACHAATTRERPRLGESCLWAALRVAFAELGARLSLCQGSALGAPAWRQLGYEAFTSYGRFLAPPQLNGHTAVTL